MNGMWRYKAGDLVWLHDHPGARIGLIREGLWSSTRGPLYEIEPLRPAYVPGVTLVVTETYIEKVVGQDGSTYRPAAGEAYGEMPELQESERRRVTLPVLIDRRDEHPH